MSGRELKDIADVQDLKPMTVAVTAGISICTLYKVYNDLHVSPKSKLRVERAIKQLLDKLQAKTA